MVAFDEGRFGLITWLRRRWCPLGERPPWIVQDEYEWLWLYTAVEPTTGTGVFLLLPNVDSQCWELFLRHLRKRLSNTLFTTLDELQNALIDELQQFWEHPTALLQLTGYPWWVEAIQNTISSFT